MQDMDRKKEEREKPVRERLSVNEQQRMGETQKTRTK